MFLSIQSNSLQVFCQFQISSRDNSWFESCLDSYYSWFNFSHFVTSNVTQKFKSDRSRQETRKVQLSTVLILRQNTYRRNKYNCDLQLYENPSTNTRKNAPCLSDDVFLTHVVVLKFCSKGMAGRVRVSYLSSFFWFSESTLTFPEKRYRRSTPQTNSNPFSKTNQIQEHSKPSTRYISEYSHVLLRKKWWR